MDKIIIGNVLMNFVAMVIFMGLNNWALQNSFEETFAFLALSYGVVTVIINALFISIVMFKLKK